MDRFGLNRVAVPCGDFRVFSGLMTVECTRCNWRAHSYSCAMLALARRAHVQHCSTQRQLQLPPGEEGFYDSHDRT
jgi:hypothetical protein